MQDVSRSEGRTVLFVSHNMAAVHSLCKKGIVLKDGMMAFAGTTEDAIHHYLNEDQEQTGKTIKECIKWKKNFLTINSIKINHSESTSTIISSNQKTLNIRLEGETLTEMKTDLMLIIKNPEGVPMAALIEGHYKGKIDIIKKGAFVLEKNIILPKYLSRGDYYADLFLHHPMYEYQLKAPHCIDIRADGSQADYGRPIRCKYSGFEGLETI